MKKFTKITLILASVCIVLGMSLIIGVGIFGDMLDQRANVHIGMDGIRIQDHNADIHVGLDGVKINGIELEDNSEKEQLVLAKESVRSIEIAANAVDLEIIRREDTDEIVLEDVSEYLEFSSQMNKSEDGKKLTLEIWRKDQYKIAGISGAASAVLVIPADVSFRNVNIEMNASALTVDSIEAEELELEVNAASVEIADFNARNLDVNNNASAVTVHGNVERELDVEVNAGDVEVQLTGGYQDFNYSLKTNAGSIQIADQEYSGLDEERNIEYAAAKKAAELECNMGSIAIGFFDEV